MRAFEEADGAMTTFYGNGLSRGQRSAGLLGVALAVVLAGCGGRPEVESVSPVSGSTQIAVNAVVTLVFTEKLKPDSVTADTVKVLRHPDLAAVGGTLELGADGRTVTFRLAPGTTLQASTQYVVRTTAGVLGTSGEKAEAFESRFTTSSSVVADTVAPKALGISPADASANVRAGESVTVTFDEPLNAATVNSTTFQVRETASGGALVAGIYLFDVNKVTFRPEPGLEYGKTYQVTLSAAITDLSGNALAAPFSASFTTLTPVGGPLVSLESGTPDATQIRAFTDGANRTHVVWVQEDPSGNQLQWTKLDVATGMVETSAPVPSTGSLSPYRFHLAGSFTGKLAVAWGSGAALWVSVYSGSAWTGPFELTSALTGSEDFAVAIDDSGAVVAVWNQGLSGKVRVMASRMSVGPNSAWSQPVPVDAPTEAGSTVPRIGMSGAGSALVAFTSGGTAFGEKDLLFTRCTVVSDSCLWSSPAMVDAAASSASSVDLAVDRAGNAVVVWLSGSTSAPGTLGARFDPVASSWSTPRQLLSGSPPTAYGFNPKVAMANGHAIAIWRERAASAERVYARAYSVGGGWATEAVGMPPTPVLGYSYDVSMAPNGRALVVWHDHVSGSGDDVRSAVWVRRYAPGTGFGAVELVQYGPFKDHHGRPIGAINDGGKGVALLNLFGNVLAKFLP